MTNTLSFTIVGKLNVRVLWVHIPSSVGNTNISYLCKRDDLHRVKRVMRLFLYLRSTFSSGFITKYLDREVLILSPCLSPWICSIGGRGGYFKAG